MKVHLILLEATVAVVVVVDVAIVVVVVIVDVYPINLPLKFGLNRARNS